MKIRIHPDPSIKTRLSPAAEQERNANPDLYTEVFCPVCGSKTLDSHWICDECKWEYDGQTEDWAYSSCNGATVAAYRAKHKQDRIDLLICSKEAAAKLIRNGFPQNTAVISFDSPKNEETRLRYESVCNRIFYVSVPDLDLSALPRFGYSEETYLTEADSLATFIDRAKEDGMDILCQCEYGQSRSAACAAAILQHYEQRGIDIFADYRYYPNQLVYHKIFQALEKIPPK